MFCYFTGKEHYEENKNGCIQALNIFFFTNAYVDEWMYAMFFLFISSMRNGNNTLSKSLLLFFQRRPIHITLL